MGTARGTPPVADVTGIVDDASSEAASREHLVCLTVSTCYATGSDGNPQSFDHGLRCPDWEGFAWQYIGMLRAAVAVDPTHPRATTLIGELSIQSADFRRLWARHDVRTAVRGTKTFHHPEVGELTLG